MRQNVLKDKRTNAVDIMKILVSSVKTVKSKLNK